MTRRLRTLSSVLPLFLTPFLIAAQDPKPRDTPAKTDESARTTSADEPKPKDADKPKADEAKPATDPDGRVVKSLEEWRRLLTGPQFMVTRMKATEPPFSGRYASGHFRGTFVCVCCGAELFSSAHKFESGTGWPSFYRPISRKALRAAPDYSEGQPRIEVTCARCGAHLGHVFPDGPPPTGRRFCINSLALKLLPPGASGRKSASKSKSDSDSKAPKAEPAPDAEAQAKDADPMP